MHSMLKLAEPAMPHLAYGLRPADLKKAARTILSDNSYGLTVSTIGGAFGPTWPERGEHSLDFLEHFGGLKHLSVSLPNLVSLEPLRFVCDTLETLYISGFMKPPKLSLSPVGDCRKLRALGLVRLPKDLDVIWDLPALERLSLTGYSQSDLQPTKPLKKLRSFYVGFGGLTNVDFVSLMPKVAAIEIVRTKGLADLSSLTELTQLQFIGLCDLAQVEAFPNCKGLRKLRRAYLDTLNGLKDLQGLANAPNLEELIVINSKALPEVFEPLVHHRKLKRATIGLASRKASAVVDEQLGEGAFDLFGSEYEEFELK
jgi:hypothetical protein